MSETVKDEGAERKAVRSGTVNERRAYTDARREAAVERDAARFRLAAEPSEVAIAQNLGYLSIPPETLGDLTAPIVEHANALIDSIGHDALFEQGAKGGFIARGFLPDDAFQLDSPYLRFALSERLVGPIASYLGVVPVLTDIDVWYSAHHPKRPKSSQLWHLDHADTKQVKVWVHLSDIGPESGPLTMIAADRSDEIADANDYNFGESYRLPDDRVSEDEVVQLTGPPGTVDFADTSRCFHMGSRVDEDAEPRRVCMLQYLTPYSFKFGDHREQASYRHLATDTSTELERLVLGAA